MTHCGVINRLTYFRCIRLINDVIFTKMHVQCQIMLEISTSQQCKFGLEKRKCIDLSSFFLGIFTIEPGYGDTFKEDQEQQTHSTGRIVVKEFEHVETTLWREESPWLASRAD